MQPTGNPYLDATMANNMNRGPAAPTQAAKPASHGFLGSLYDAVLKPTVKTLTDIPSDLYHGLTATGIAAGSVARGEHGSVAASTKQRALDEMKKSAGYGQFFKPTVDEQNAGGVGKTLEGIGGKGVSNIANVEAFNPALLGMKGASTAAKIGNAAKVGGSLGAAQGTGQAMQQGGDLGQVGDAALAGGLAGAATGAALQGAGSAVKGITGRLTGKAKTGNIPVRTATTGKEGFAGNAAFQAGQDKAQNTIAANEAPFNVSGAKQGINNATAKDKSGLPVSLQQVHDFLRGVKMSPDTGGGSLPENMQILHDASMESINNHLDKATAGIKVDGSDAASVGRDAVMGEVGNLGSNKRSGAAVDTLAQVRIDTKGLSRSSSVADILGAISKLEGRQADIHAAVQAGDKVSTGQNNVYQKVIDHLHDQMNESHVNEAIKGYRMTLGDANALRADTVNGGGSHELATHLIDTINNGKNYASQRSARQIPLIAGKLADAQRMAEAKAVTQEVPGSDRAVSGTAAEGAIAINNPGFGPFAAAHILARNYNKLKAGAAKMANPGAYEAGLQQGLAPAPDTAAKINLGNQSAGMPGGGATPPPGPPAPSGGLNPTLAANGGNILGMMRNATANNAGGAVTGPPVPQQQPNQGQPVAMGSGDIAQQVQPQSDYPLQAMEADIARDPKNASTYMELEKMMNSSTSSTAGNIKPNATQYGEAQSGMQSLQQLSDMIQQNPNIVGQTAIPGQNMPLIGGLVRSAAGTGDYQAAAQNTLDALARARTGAAMSKQEEAFYQRMLPQAGDNPQTVQFKLQQLQTAFQPFLQVNDTGVSSGQ
jgi:hypothetical protein